MQILMADDDEGDRRSAAKAWKTARAANPIHFVNDGEELMDYLYHRGKFADAADWARPGLILLDLNMPKKDGREALREIKADPELRQIPVVVLTSSCQSLLGWTLTSITPGSGVTLICCRRGSKGGV